MKITFYETGPFEAMRAAEDWCDARGISFAPPERGQPRGLVIGDYVIAKWSNLRPHERRAMDGRMTGDMRHGPVTVDLPDIEDRDVEALRRALARAREASL